MNKLIRRVCLLATLIFIPGTLLLAQTGTLTGFVQESQTGDRLPGANIVIESIYLGASTNLNGEFVLNNVPQGTSVIKISYLGYQEQEITIEMAAKETKSIEISLNVLAIEGEEVVITAQLIGQRAAINQQLSSNTVMNVVSSEKIEELPDANAAEAIGRLPGVSLKRSSGEANKVVIRGLSPKYNNVTIEGIKMASTSDFDRSVDLSLVQSELLSGIEVTKSLRADMDADALGGTVNLRLMKAPNKRKVSFGVEGGYANLGNDYANYKFNGGISDRFLDKKLGVSVKASHEQKQMPSHRFNAGYSPIEWQRILDDAGDKVDSTLRTFTQNTSLVDQHQVRKRTNASLILDYQNDWWEAKFFNLLSIKNDDVLTRTNRYTFNTSGSAQNFDLTINADDWNTMTRIHTFQNTFRFGNSKLNVDVSTTYASQNQSDESYPFVETNTFGLDQNWLYYRNPRTIMDTIGGPEALDVNSTLLRSFDKGDRTLIDESYDAKIDYELSYTLGGSINGKLKAGIKVHQLTRSSDGNSIYNSFEWGGSSSRRTSLLNLYPDDAEMISVPGRGESIGAATLVDPNYNPGEFLNGRWELGWTPDAALLQDMQAAYYENFGANYFRRGVESYTRDYRATEFLTAGYIMTEINIGSKLMLLPGVRYERNQTEYFAYHIQISDVSDGIEPNPDSITTDRDNYDFYPSLNLKYKITQSLALQAAAYKSTSRPSFRQISPMVIYPSTSDNIRSNNPWLRPSSAWNFDMGISYNSPKIGLFTLYGYHKQIQDLIFNLNGYKPYQKELMVGTDSPKPLDDRLLGAEYYDPIQLTDARTTNLPFNSTELATVTGIEASWQTSFWYLPGLLKGIVLDLNYSKIWSSTAYPFFETIVVDKDDSGFITKYTYGQQYSTREGPLQDQPASIINVILGYDLKGFSGRISYRYQSQTVESLDTRYSTFDSYYDTFTLLDVMLKQQITDFMSVYVNMTNIGNHIDDYYFGEQVEKDRPALPTSSQFYGFRAQFGVRLKF
jgi:TonB-dependent receptor